LTGAGFAAIGAAIAAATLDGAGALIATLAGSGALMVAFC
jgi:hypothetical protein